MSDLIKDIVSEWSMKLYNGTPDIHDSGHLLILHDILNKRKLPEEAVSMIIDGLRQLNEFPDTMTNQGDTGVPTSTLDYGKTHTKSLTYSTSSTSVGAMDFIDPIQPQDTYQKLHPEEDDDPYADDDEVDEVVEFKFDPDLLKIVETGNMIPLMEVLMDEKFKCFMTGEVYCETKDGGLVKETDIVKKNLDRGQSLVKKDASEEHIAKAEKGEPIDQKAPESDPEAPKH